RRPTTARNGPPRPPEEPRPGAPPVPDRRVLGVLGLVDDPGSIIVSHFRVQSCQAGRRRRATRQLRIERDFETPHRRAISCEARDDLVFAGAREPKIRQGGLTWGMGSMHSADDRYMVQCEPTLTVLT